MGGDDRVERLGLLLRGHLLEKPEEEAISLLSLGDEPQASSVELTALHHSDDQFEEPPIGWRVRHQDGDDERLV